MRNLKNYLYIGFGLLLLCSLSLWSFASSTIQDFGISLFTETLGIAITLFFIEKIIEANKANELKPIDSAAYNDVRLLINRYINFLQELYQRSINEPQPETLEDFLTIDTISKIWNNLDMKAKPHVFPEIDMWTYFQNQAKDFNDLGSKILDRHGWHLDPQIYKNVHSITESHLITSWKNSMVALINLDNQNNWPRPKILAAYSIEPNQEDLNSILFLYKWCFHKQIELSKHFTLEHLIEYMPQKGIAENLDYRKNQLELKIETEIWNNFQGK